MKINNSVGIKGVYVYPLAEKDAAATMPAFGSDWVTIGDVLNETAEVNDDEPEVTTYTSETSNKEIIIGENSTTATLTLMDPDFEQLARYCGGSVSGDSEGKKIYTRPKAYIAKQFAIAIVPKMGAMQCCPCVTLIPALNSKVTKKGITTLKIKMKYKGDMIMKQEIVDPTTGKPYSV